MEEGRGYTSAPELSNPALHFGQPEAVAVPQVQSSKQCETAPGGGVWPCLL